MIKGDSTLSGSPGMEGGAKLLPRAKGQAFYCRGLRSCCPGGDSPITASQASSSKSKPARPPLPAFVLGSPVKDTIRSPLG